MDPLYSALPTMFDLGARVTTSEIRREDELATRLKEYGGRLRLERHGAIVGVIVSPELWDAIQTTIVTLQRTVDELDDRLEEAEVKKIIEARADAKPVGGKELVEGVRNELAAMGLL